MMKGVKRVLEGRRLLVLAGDVMPLVSPLSVIAPSEDTSGLFLGEDDRGRRIFLNPERLPNMHGVIVGSTGVGKSTLARHLILEARQLGIRSWVIDPHGEEAYARLFHKTVVFTKDKVDVLHAPGWDALEYASELGRYVERIYGFRGARNMIRNVIASCIRHGGLEPLRELSDLDPDIKRLYDDLTSIHGEGEKIEELARRNAYFTLPLMTSRELAALAIQVLLLLLQGFMRSQGARHRLELLIILEEAHVLSPYLLSLFKEVRKWGYSIVAVSQLPREFDPRIFQLAGFVLALSGPESYVRDIEAIFFVTGDERDHILYSPRGTALFFRQGDPRPRKIFLKLRAEAFS
ncbi:ATP-binding protein [Infirmifilum lucidum]|uniref:ATP-binding protein n=1 Tax=Infirmifilum lucidum TaxID=2776706 RepID=A0A7L9FKV2_9CREN|nr:DUF87 domain-containing protein [Infirmifilum lucidum]QOJ79653.1 ATP-binding protein [Infirmifilum lucidum]